MFIWLFSLINQIEIAELPKYLKSKVVGDTSECSSIVMLQLLCLNLKETNTIAQIYKVFFYTISFILKYFSL